MLQQIALADDEAEAPKDHTLPDLEGMEPYKAVFEDCASSIYTESYDPVAVYGRKAPAAKKIKVDISDIDFQKLYKADNLNSLTMPYLSQFMRSVDLSVAGRKAELIERIDGYFSTKGIKKDSKEED
eukprot:gene18699-6115_t